MSTFMIPKNGAFQEPEDVKRKQDGAWVEAESAKRIIDGAWTEVWSNAFKMQLIELTIDNGSGGTGSDDWTYLAGQASSGGYAILAAEGDFYNPAISFLYEMWFYHSGVSQYITGGDLYAYGVRAGGTVDEVLLASSATQAPTQATHTFTGGSYTKVGFKYKAIGSNPSISGTVYAGINDFTIDGKKCEFDPADNFNFN